MKKQKEWKLVRGSWIANQPVLPGIWQRKEGGHVVRGRATDPRTGKLKDVWRVLPDSDRASAYNWLRGQLEEIRNGVVSAESPKVPFANYAVSLLKRKIENREIKSAAGRRKWGVILNHLFADSLGELYVDQIQVADIEGWKSRMAAKINAGEYSATTINTWFSVLRVVMGQATIDCNLSRNATAGVRYFDTSEHHTYTEEEPNALTVEELREFLACMRERYPQHFAMTYTGFATGLRPSSMRPLRRSGPTPDVLWDQNVLLIRQSQMEGKEVMQCTKTGAVQRIAVPEQLVDVLRWHVDTRLRLGLQKNSLLLFPSEDGGFRARSVLDKPFREVTKAIQLTKRITPRAMRRSFQDLARAAEVCDIVTRSISGHATAEMQRRYSTVSRQEQADGLRKVLKLMDFTSPSNTDHSVSPGEPSGEFCGEDRPLAGRVGSSRAS